MARVAQVVEGRLDVRVIDRPLENLAIDLEDGGPGRFGLAHHVTDRPIDARRALPCRRIAKNAQLPLHTRVTRFLRKPNVKLSPRQRERPVIKFHPVYLLNALVQCPCPADNLSRKLFGRISVQFCSM